MAWEQNKYQDHKQQIFVICKLLSGSDVSGGVCKSPEQQDEFEILLCRSQPFESLKTCNTSAGQVFEHMEFILTQSKVFVPPLTLD